MVMQNRGLALIRRSKDWRDEMDVAAWTMKAAKLYFQLVDMCAAGFRHTPAVGIKVTRARALFLGPL